MSKDRLQDNLASQGELAIQQRYGHYHLGCLLSYFARKYRGCLWIMLLLPLAVMALWQGLPATKHFKAGTELSRPQNKTVEAPKNAGPESADEFYQREIQQLLTDLPAAAAGGALAKADNKATQAGKKPNTPKPLASAKQESVVPSPANGNPGKVINIALAAQHQDKKVARQARKLIAKDNVEEAKTRLLKQLEIDANSRQSAKALAQVYWQEGGKAELEKLIQHSPVLNDFDRLTFQAKTLQGLKQYRQAAELLATHKPSLRDHSDYYRLQASLLNRLQQHSAAANIYSQLLELHQYSPSYWLGLAVSMESMGQRQQAMEALLKAERYSRKQSSMHRFIQQRIHRLASRQTLAQG